MALGRMAGESILGTSSRGDFAVVLVIGELLCKYSAFMQIEKRTDSIHGSVCI